MSTYTTDTTKQAIMLNDHMPSTDTLTRHKCHLLNRRTGSGKFQIGLTLMALVRAFSCGAGIVPGLRF